MVQHFVITRFDLAADGRPVRKRTAPGWLDRRFDLFETFCLPSMAGQTITPFHWLVYFDEATPVPYYERIGRAKLWVDFEARFVTPFTPALVARDVAKRTDPAADIVLTTWIDIEHAVARNFIERTQKEAACTPTNSVVSFRNGLAFKDGKVYPASATSKGVSTIVEDGNRPFKAIWAAAQDAPTGHRSVRLVQGAPAWLQVVQCLCPPNRVMGPRVGDHAALRAFSLDQGVSIRPVSRTALLCDRLIGAPFRSVCGGAIALAQRLVGRS